MASSKAATRSIQSKSNVSTPRRPSLTPLKKIPKSKPFSVADIESRKWIDFLVIGHYDGENVEFFYDLDLFLQFVFDHPHDCVFLHFGGIFDFLFILSEVLKSTRFRLESLIPRGSGVLCFSVTDGRRTIHFRDSSALLPFGLKTLAKNFNVETQKGSIDYEKIESVTDELLVYLRSDLLALFQVLTAFYESEIIKESGAKTTIASQSVQVLRRYLSRPINSVPSTVDAFIRSGYAGGRTEIFRPLFDGTRTTEKIRCYDINSLYPSVMAGNDFPGDFTGFSSQLDLTKEGFHEVYVEVSECYAPILWRKNPKFIFPIGRFWGVYSTPELARSIRENQCRIIEHRRSAYFTSAGPVFDEFVRDLYGRRKRSNLEVDRTIIKLVLNSCYGRIGLNLEKEGLEIDYAQKNVTPDFRLNIGGKIIGFVRSSTQLKSFSHPGIAAYVTAYARIKNFEFLRQFESSIHYTDTDSFYTTQSVATSGELGALKLESEDDRACFLLPKTYITSRFSGNIEGTAKTAMKGFDKRKIQNFRFEDFQSALAGELKLKINTESRMNRMKTAMRSGNLLNMSKVSTKEIRSRYDKRILFRTNAGKWDSRPIKLSESKNDR